MTAAAQKVTIVVHEFQIEGYQLSEDGQNLLLKTHRQIGEIVGKTKGTAQKFIKQHADEFPPPVTASIPERPRPVALTPWEAAVAYWQHLAEIGNDTAIALTTALDNLPLSDFEIVSEIAVPTAPTIETETNQSELQRACGWHLHRLEVDGRSRSRFRSDRTLATGGTTKESPRTGQCSFFSASCYCPEYQFPHRDDSEAVSGESI